MDEKKNRKKWYLALGIIVYGILCFLIGWGSNFLFHKTDIDREAENDTPMCSRSKFLSKIFKINVKNFREIFPDFTHRKRGSDFITVPFLSSGSHALRLPSAFPFSVPCLEYTLSVLQQSNLTPHISGLYALPSN